MISISDNSRLPRALPGFDHIKRYWDKTHECVAAKILPGEYYISATNELITTVLGSCVSACVRDHNNGIGGMNHFMLPANRLSEVTLISEAARYGNYAMEHMINDILRYGGERRNLEFKLFGGGKVLSTMMDIGKKNIDFILDYIQTEGFKISSEDLGDVYPRKVIYFPQSGRVRVKKLKKMHNQTIINRENEYLQKIKQQPVAGDIELF